MNIPLSKKEKIRILNTEDLYGVMQQFLLREDKIDQNRELFWVIGLASDQRILFIELISLGSVTSTVVEPMEVFSLALQKRAVSIILCHNHPSGTLKPSDADLDLTDRLIQVGIIVNTPVADHHIISTKGFLSFDDIGLMQELKKSVKYVPSFEVEKRIRAEAAAIVKQREIAFKAQLEEMEQKVRIAEQEKISIVQGLKKEGIAVGVIAKITGLSVEEIEGL